MFNPTLCLKMGAYFINIFELITANHKLLRFARPHLVAYSTWSNRILSLDTCILFDARRLGKGNKLNIPWLSLHWGRKKNVNNQCNTHHKLTVKWQTIEIALTWRPVPKQIGILLTYFSLIIMVRNCYVYFILHYAWRWIQISEKLLN